MAGYIGTQAVSVNTTSATISDDLAVGDDLTVTDDATIGGTLGVTGVLTTTARSVSSGGITINNTDSIRPAANNANINISGGQATNDGANLALFGGDHATPDLVRFRSSGDTTMVITQAGNVAIGSTTPEENTNFVALTVGPGASTGGGQVYVESSSVRGVFGADNNGSDPKTIIGTTTNHPLVFFQNNADVGRFDASENFTIKTGNLVIGTDGKGIDFSNQTPTAESNAAATSELLDHYEEGTFTAANGNWSNVSEAIGNYTRIGNIVYWNYYTRTFSPGSGSATFDGLPFAAVNDTGRYYIFNSQHNNAIDGGSVGGYTVINTATVRFTDVNSISTSNFTGGDNKYMMNSGFYAVV